MYIVVSLVIVVVAIIVWGARGHAFHKVVLEKRQNKEEMIKNMYNRFSSDYKKYEDLQYDTLEVFSDEGLRLRGCYYNVNPNSDKVVIIHHGYTANHYVCLQFADIFFEQGYNCLLLDMRGHGDSEGKYATYGYKEREDLDKWVDLMRKKVGNSGIIGLHGQSMGGATVLMYGGKYGEKIDFIVADCAYSRGKDIIKSQFKQAKVPFYPMYNILNRKLRSVCGFDMNKISPIDDIKGSKVPVLFVHGTGDKLVPHHMSEEMYNAKRGESDRLLLIADAIHVGAYSKDKEKYKREIKIFVEDILNKKSSCN